MYPIDRPRAEKWRRWLGEHTRPRYGITCTVYDEEGKIEPRELWLVRCCDGISGPGRVHYVAFGPADEPLPLRARIRTGPVTPGMTVAVQCYQDNYGIFRYLAPRPPNFTSN
jgi:hypothetical protein